MSQEPCYIPFKLSQLKIYVIPAGVTSYTVTNIASQILPKQVIFTLIHNQALTHDNKFNPFNFRHFDLNYFNLIKNGQCVFPKAFQPDFDDDNYMDLYRHMYDSTGFGISNSSCDISPGVFNKGRCFLTADLTPPPRSLQQFSHPPRRESGHDTLGLVEHFLLRHHQSFGFNPSWQSFHRLFHQ